MTENLIDEVLTAMGREYRPGLIPWLTRYPDKWTKVCRLEAEINQATLVNDRGRLVIALGNYRLLFRKMADLFKSEMDTERFAIVTVDGGLTDNEALEAMRIQTAQDSEATPKPIQNRHETGESEEQEMRVNKMFPSKYFSKDDLPKPTVFTINTVVMDEVQNEDGKEEKPILYFADDGVKPLILNKTNAEILASEFGPDSDDWTGHEIELYVDPSIRFGKQKIGGIRVRTPDASSKEAVV